MMTRLMLKALRVTAAATVSAAILILPGVPGYAEDIQPEASFGIMAVPAPELAGYVGDAYDSLSGSFMGTAVENVQAVRQAGTANTSASYELIETDEQFKNFYKRAISSSVGGSFFDITADVSFQNSIERNSSFSSNKLAIAIMYKFDGGQVVLNGASFTPDASQLISGEQVDTFKRFYGNSFVKKSYYGGLLYMTYIAEITDSSKVTKSEVKAALEIKYKSLIGASVSAQELESSENTLRKVRISGFSQCTNDLLSSNDIVDTRDKLDAKVREFANYYNGIKNGQGEYYVFGRELAPYWNIPGSGYYDSSLFPEFYNPSKFFASNFTVAKTTDVRTVELRWQDNCDYEDGYNVYLKAGNAYNPTLVQHLPENSSSATVALSESALNEGYSLWAVPVKNGIDGGAFNPKFESAPYNVQFYADPDFTGRSNEFSGDMVYVPFFGDYFVGNDKISSIKINGPFEVTVYEHINYGGRSQTYRFSDVYTKDENFDDIISSAIIRRIPESELDGVYLFEHNDYSGKWVKVNGEISNMGYTVVGNDKVSSVLVAGNHAYRLYKDADFKGAMYEGTGSIPEMKGTNIGNDMLSSIQILH